MQLNEIKNKIEGYTQRGLKLFTTSSFQTHSTVLLHILSNIDKNIPVYFIHTGYHFPETLTYRDLITEKFRLNLINVFSTTSKINQRDTNKRLLYASDPDLCCHLNKVAPLEPILAAHDIWINGVRADQGEVRKNFNVEQKAKFGTIRFHPMLDWSGKMIYDYIREHNIPKHPLEEKGYSSIGCEPCTRKWGMEEEGRGGRWFGLKKSECGLNTDLVA
jgi:phosphoadenosine phosphosulfate reductase